MSYYMLKNSLSIEALTLEQHFLQKQYNPFSGEKNPLKES
jgi:hypothetical protein